MQTEETSYENEELESWTEEDIEMADKNDTKKLEEINFELSSKNHSTNSHSLKEIGCIKQSSKNFEIDMNNEDKKVSINKANCTQNLREYLLPFGWKKVGKRRISNPNTWDFKIISPDGTEYTKI